MANSKKDESLFVIHYRDPQEGDIVSLKAKEIYDSPLGLSFVKVAGFVFENNSLVVKPSEEHLKKRLENVKSLHLSLYSIISIEEIGAEPPNLSFKNDKSNLVVLPQDTSQH